MTSTLKKISRRVALTLAVSACFSPVTQAAELLTEGVFKVGMEVTYPPFESYDSNNNIVGLDPEFAALIAQHLQAKPQLIDTKFTSLILGIGKKYDAVISGMYVTPERQKQADAIPYALSGASIIALKGGAVQPKTEDELCGVKVGLQAGTTWVTSLKKHSDEWCLKNGKPAITIQEFPTAPEASQALLSK
ncbi:transporter substrate-binding domain-containing protein, partial [Klebsiella pneumoniae]